MRMNRIGAAALALALMMGVLPAAAMAAQVGDLAMVLNPTRQPDPEKAAELMREAESLFADPDEWSRAARLLERSAELRDEADPKAYTCLVYAARVRSALGDMDDAREDFEKAAAQALARGAVVEAANAYIDAAHAAVALKDAQGARALTERASLLAHSPLISSRDRSLLEARLNA